MSRLPLLRPDQLNDAQRSLYDSILGGPRGRAGLADDEGGLRGPFNAWLYSTDTGKRISRLGEGLRFANSLPKNVMEVAILVMARDWRAQFEGWAHERIARREGVSDAVIEAIRTRRTPHFDDPQEELAHRFASELLETRRVSDALYAEATASFGEQGVVDLVSLLGYYSLISMTLNVFGVALPPGEEPLYEEAPED